MEVRDRLLLLDRLLALGNSSQIPERDITALTNFLADLPDSERDGVLEFICQDDMENRVIRFARIAQMDRDAQQKMLRAIGIDVSSMKHSLNEAFSLVGEHAAEAKQVLGSIASAREEIENTIWKPLRQLLGRKTEKP
jgi:hypothetical protein